MSDLSITTTDSVQLIRFTRVDKKNALTSAMYAAMADALAAGDADAGVAAHVFMGSGGIFCAGNDIKEFLLRAQGEGGLGEPVIRFIRALPQVLKPMIAAVDGPAIGIGTTMLLHCDLVYASPSANLRTPFLDLGILPEAGSSLLLPRRVGHARAFEMLALGAPIAAERAREMGIVNAVLPAEALEATALQAAHALAAKPPEALALARRLMRGDTAEVVARIDAEVVEFRRRLASPEAREAFQAFLEKRKPVFRRV